MNTYSVLYAGQSSILPCVKSGALDSNVEYLIRIYTGSALKEKAAEVAREIKQLFPKSHILGCNTVGIMFQDVLYEDETMVLFDRFEHAGISVKTFSWRELTSVCLAEALAEFAETTQARLMHVLCSDQYSKSHEVICEFNKLNTFTKLVGGVAGNIVNRNIESYVFDEEGVKPFSVMAASISGKGVKAKSWVNISHEPISQVFTLTETEGEAIISIEGQDAKEWIQDQLGFEKMREFSDWNVAARNDELVRFPIVLEGHHGASRYLRFDEQKDRICQYNSEMSDGTQFRIGYTNPQSVVKNTSEICKDMAFQPVESLFFYSCFFRKMYLSNCTSWEMLPYKGNGLCGAFMMGEIGNINGVNEYLNGSSVLTGIAENDVFLKPDQDFFLKMGVIEDETKDLLNFVLLRQKTLLSRINEKLLADLMLSQERSKNRLLYEANTGLPNSVKYKKDLAGKNYDKLCLVVVENPFNVISYIKQDRYYAALQRETHAIKDFLYPGFHVG